MKIRQDDNSAELTESTLPMINVVFLLLIFFMIAGSLQKTIPFNITPLQAQADTAQQQAPLIIHVAADGRIMVGEKEVTSKTLRRTILEQLSTNVSSASSSPPNSMSWSPDKASETQPSRPITIRSDQSTNTTAVVKILSLLKEMNIKQVALATVR
ncbi:ExbD/TolR family protein [Kiloniella spongiae]|uniref:ExbD/TolR family protein n=1 Tax=Kiloniella spongiae TaxID=1489064 RepID=UPI00069C9D19|nr:biopolymer transporter ExbD [Kiloniella spongiae]